MKYWILIFLLTTHFLFACEKTEIANEEEPQTTFYIDTQDDFDQWSNHDFPEGSKVLFAVDETFKGQFILRGSGSANAPNLVTAYNKETKKIFLDWIDDKPRIDGEGKLSSSVWLKNGSYWKINNLEVTNTNGTTDDQGNLLGIKVTAQDIGDVQDVSIKNCYVHHVNGEVGGKETGGIHINVIGSVKKTKFNNLSIENNHITHVGGVGISNQSSWRSINTADYYPGQI